jgi:hypothetical protein
MCVKDSIHIDRTRTTWQSPLTTTHSFITGNRVRYLTAALSSEEKHARVAPQWTAGKIYERLCADTHMTMANVKSRVCGEGNKGSSRSRSTTQAGRAGGNHGKNIISIKQTKTCEDVLSNNGSFSSQGIPIAATATATATAVSEKKKTGTSHPTHPPRPTSSVPIQRSRGLSFAHHVYSENFPSGFANIAIELPGYESYDADDDDVAKRKRRAERCCRDCGSPVPEHICQFPLEM